MKDCFFMQEPTTEIVQPVEKGNEEMLQKTVETVAIIVIETTHRGSVEFNIFYWGIGEVEEITNLTES